MFAYSENDKTKTNEPEIPTSGGNAESLIKWGIETIKSGNRNNALYWVYNRCIENDYDASHVINTINANMESPLDSRELNKILRK
jgi:hypothetical protein